LLLNSSIIYAADVPGHRWWKIYTREKEQEEKIMAQLKIYRHPADADTLQRHPGLEFLVEGRPVRIITNCGDGPLVGRIIELIHIFGDDMTEQTAHLFIEMLKSDDVNVIRDMISVMTFSINGGGDNRAYEHTPWGVIEVVADDLAFAQKLGDELKVLLKTVDNGSDYPTHEKIRTVISVIQTIHAYRIDELEYKTSRRYKDELEF
jgi:hypothetical protein